MADIYVSTNIANGKLFDELIGKLIQYKPETFGWTKLNEETTIDLKSYFNSGDKNGNWVITKYNNGPSGVTTTPLNISVIKTKLDNIVANYEVIRDGKKVYVRNCSNSTNDWIDYSTKYASGEDMVEFVRSDTTPSNTDGIWIDTSTDNNSIKVWNGTKWVELSIPDSMNRSVYDTTNKKISPYTYLNDAISDIMGDYGDYLKHKANELTLIHVTSDERTYFNDTLLSVSDLTTLINSYKTELEKEIVTDFNTVTGLDKTQASATEYKSMMDEHIKDHLTEAKVTSWDQKASSTHTHEAANNDVKIDGSNIVSGKIPLSKLPSEMVERVYSISSLNVLASSSITDTDRKSTYHNGNTLYIEGATDTEDKWYKIIDQTKIGTSSYLDGIIEFKSGRDIEPTWANLVGVPSTVSGYNLSGDLYTKTELDEKITSDVDLSYATEIDDLLTANNTLDVSGDSMFGSTIEYVGFQCALSESIANNTTYPMLKNSSIDTVIKLSDGRVYRGKYNNDLIIGLDFVETTETESTIFFTEFPCNSSDIKSNEGNGNWATYGLGSAFSTATKGEYIISFSTYNIGDVEITLTINEDKSISFNYRKADLIVGLSNSLQSNVDFIEDVMSIDVSKIEVTENWPYNTNVTNSKYGFTNNACLNCVIYANDYYVAVGYVIIDSKYEPLVLTTKDPTGEWTYNSNVTSTKIGYSGSINTRLNSVTYNDGLYVAVGYCYIDSVYNIVIAVGADPSSTWPYGYGHMNSDIGLNNDSQLNSVITVNNEYVAVGYTGTEPLVLTSYADPCQQASWTYNSNVTREKLANKINLGGSNKLYSITYANGYYIAVGNNGNHPLILYTTDPTGEWIYNSNVSNSNYGFSKTSYLRSITYTNGYYIAVGNSYLSGTTSNPLILYTKDPTGEWIYNSNVTNDKYGFTYDSYLYSITHTNGYYIAVGYNSISTYYNPLILYTKDPTGEWTYNSNVTNDKLGISNSIYLYSITYGNGYYIAVGYNSTSTTFNPLILYTTPTNSKPNVFTEAILRIYGNENSTITVKAYPGTPITCTKVSDNTSSIVVADSNCEAIFNNITQGEYTLSFSDITRNINITEDFSNIDSRLFGYPIELIVDDSVTDNSEILSVEVYDSSANIVESGYHIFNSSDEYSSLLPYIIELHKEQSLNDNSEILSVVVNDIDNNNVDNLIEVL